VGKQARALAVNSILTMRSPGPKNHPDHSACSIPSGYKQPNLNHCRETRCDLRSTTWDTKIAKASDDLANSSLTIADDPDGTGS
jgi:hypothetical protein